MEASGISGHSSILFIFVPVQSLLYDHGCVFGGTGAAARESRQIAQGQGDLNSVVSRNGQPGFRTADSSLPAPMPFSLEEIHALCRSEVDAKDSIDAPADAFKREG